MTAQIIDGRAIASRLTEGLKQQISGNETPPCLAVVLAGDDPASHIYVRNKEKAANAIGIKVVTHILSNDVAQADLCDLIHTLNKDQGVDGILVQLPLPAGIVTEDVLQCISPLKDVDGLHVENVGKLAMQSAEFGFVPCTPQGCLMLLEQTMGREWMSGKHAVVIGCSNLVGRPMAQLLLQAECTVTIAHSKTQDLPDICRRADIVISATGCAKLIKQDWVSPDAVVIDVGISRMADGTLSGDVDFEQVAPVVQAITPVPGGVGPMTIACLLKNTVLASRR